MRKQSGTERERKRAKHRIAREYFCSNAIKYCNKPIDIDTVENIFGDFYLFSYYIFFSYPLTDYTFIKEAMRIRA